MRDESPRRMVSAAQRFWHLKSMKAEQQCCECLARLVRQAAELATEDDRLRSVAVVEGLRVLDETFSTKALTIAISTRLHQVVREAARNHDPYREMKDREMAVAEQILRELDCGPCPTIVDGVRLAVLGNVIDFFRPLDEVIEQMKQPVEFAVDDTHLFEKKLERARKVLFLADNAGEVFFDLPLLHRMRRTTQVIYVVKPSPVQNDLTLEDIARAGLQRQVGEVMTIGVASPGVLFSQASEEFKREFDSADLIFAKGMGHYEALSELAPEGRVFHCLVAKCEPVARSLQVPLGSFVAALI
jgi:damage-control phosphatase, subfamily I